MSKGNPRVTFRLPRELIHQVEETILNRNAVSPLEPWDWSKFVVIAIKEKLDKMRRSRSKSKKVRVPAVDQVQL